MKINSKYYKFYQMQMDLKKINLIEAKKVPGLIIRNYGPSDSGQLVKVFNLVF